MASAYDFGAWLDWADHFGSLEDGAFRTLDAAEARQAARPLARAEA